MSTDNNLLYYGDNLDVLRRHVADASVDLVYLDPPFNSAQDFNVLFKERNGKESSAQITAFKDTWSWDQAAAQAYQEIVEGGGKVAQAMIAFHSYLGANDMLAYLAMMAPRLVELYRVLKETGSIYLHCDPTASHYLKILMDSIFSPASFRNEINWARSTPHATAQRKFGVVCDTILFYAKSENSTWNRVYGAYRDGYLEKRYSYTDGQRMFQPTSLLGHKGVNPIFEWRGYHKPWRYPAHRLDELDKQGKIYWPPKGGVPRYKRYLDEQKGQPVLSLWTDIPAINSQAAERLGYPTQKPEALLERIINASSNKGDLVLDPFCGCGTTVAVAQRLKRRWIGIDITHLAINLMKRRLHDSFGKRVAFKVIGEPMDEAGAADLANDNPYQFQWWALGLVEARPAEGKKGADKGIDGRIYFHDEADTTKTKQVILQVKAGQNISVRDVRDLRGVIEREEADIGILISLIEPSKPMRSEAADSGFYHSPGWHKDYPRIQLRTIRELLNGVGIDMPDSNVTFKKAPKVKSKASVPSDFL
ncbi:MAG: DNA methyltransferase [Candidatus Sumerlaeota bacterium]|nr:DNA methyltransferase [Candidatus Sumerlaeota bacterium]